MRAYLIPFVLSSLVRVVTSGVMSSLNSSLLRTSCSITITTSAALCGIFTLTESPASTDGPLTTEQ